MLRARQLGVGGKSFARGVLRLLQHVHIRAEIGNVHRRKSVLARAEEIAGAAKLQVFPCNKKSVVVLVITLSRA